MLKQKLKYEIATIDIGVLAIKNRQPNHASPFPLPPIPPQTGFWTVVHESRDDYTLFFAMIFLMIVGPGKLSLDAFFLSKDLHVIEENEFIKSFPTFRSFTFLQLDWLHCFLRPLNPVLPQRLFLAIGYPKNLECILEN